MIQACHFGFDLHPAGVGMPSNKRLKPTAAPVFSSRNDRGQVAAAAYPRRSTDPSGRVLRRFKR